MDIRGTLSLGMSKLRSGADVGSNITMTWLAVTSVEPRICVTGQGHRDEVPVHLLDVLCMALKCRLFHFERGCGAHKLVRAKDGFAEGGELDSGHSDLPDAVVLHARPTEGHCDDLVAKGDA